MSENNCLTALFCGDFAPCRRWYDIEPNTEIFRNLSYNIQNADLTFVNLETPATNIGKPILKDGPNLHTKPEWLRALKDAGFNLVGLANNHMGDYGLESVIDCIENCKNHGLSIVGAGKNLQEAQRIFYFEKRDIKLAVIAVCEHEYGIAEEDKAGTAPLDVIDNIRQIQEAKLNADFVVITIHGGNEYFPYPRPGLRKLCQFYIEQGCDAVICHHPHVPSVYEIYKESPIFYSLGNFIFDVDNPPNDWNKGYVVKLIFDKATHNITYELIPYTQSFEQRGIRLMQNVEKNKFLEFIEDYKNTLLNSKQYKKVWHEFVKSKITTHLILQYCPLIIRGIGRLLKIIGGSEILIRDAKRLTGRLNFIRCESHREVLIKILTDLLNSRTSR